MKYTLLLTEECNLACAYCYISKKQTVMSHSVAKKVIDFIYAFTPSNEKIEIGYFGGEPLLQFELVNTITSFVEDHPAFDEDRVEIHIVTNGTILTNEMIDFFSEHSIGLGISCDGPPFVHDVMRRFQNGNPSASIVEHTIRKALDSLLLVPVNAVYHPRTFKYLPQTVEYLSSLGIRQIYLNPDFSAAWRKNDAALLPDVYGRVAQQYSNYYLQGDPHFISLIDSKITVILRGGYQPLERCRMGRGEFAFTPDGRIYPCERLIDSGKDGHCIGDVDRGLNNERLLCHVAEGQPLNGECLSCGLRDYCMNWCGCSNYFSSGYYNRVGPFLCASEKASIQASFDAFQSLEKTIGAAFFEHLGGIPISNSATNYRKGAI
jgi:uncharacterized protein